MSIRTWARDLYEHMCRVGKIREIKRVKNLTHEQQMRLLSDLYEKRIGHPLDWQNLCTYTEKMQWSKLNDISPIKVQLTDKVRVREWVIEKIGDKYLIPILGVWDSFDAIDFTQLPNQFVIKTNHGSGTNYIVKDKCKMKYKQAKCIFNDWLRTDFGYATGFELHYSRINPKILIEQYMETEYGELQDYKFLCFDGKPYYCWVDMGRYSNHTRNVYDLEWNLQPWNQERYENYEMPIPKPEHFDEMIEIAKVLSQGFSHVRVDLYNVDGCIYFGEMTFTNGSGLDPIFPSEYDRVLGDLWRLDTNN